VPTKVVTDGTGLVDVIERAEEPEKHIDTEGILLSLAGIGCLVTGIHLLHRVLVQWARSVLCYVNHRPRVVS
jgi:hypothetical protein